jgi:hypothetical protein
MVGDNLLQYHNLKTSSLCQTPHGNHNVLATAVLAMLVTNPQLQAVPEPDITISLELLKLLRPLPSPSLAQATNSPPANHSKALSAEPPILATMLTELQEETACMCA